MLKLFFDCDFFILKYFCLFFFKKKGMKTMDSFALAFIRQIYTSCHNWLRDHRERDVDVDYNIGMLCHICNPRRWQAREPTKNEMDAITTLLGSIIEPSFRDKAPDLWAEIDRAGTTYAIYSMRTFKEFNPNLSIIEEPDTPPASPEPNKQQTNEDEDVEEFVVAAQKRARPLVEVEHLDGEDNLSFDDDDDDDKNENPIIELPDDSDRTVETFTTPKRKRSKLDHPPSPRVLRKKIILWTTQDAADDDDDDEQEQDQEQEQEQEQKQEN